MTKVSGKTFIAYMTQNVFADIRSRLFKRWIALSSGQISLQWITQLVFLILIRWIVLYPMDSAIQRLNNRGQMLDTRQQANNSNKLIRKSTRILPPIHELQCIWTCVCVCVWGGGVWGRFKDNNKAKRT